MDNAPDTDTPGDPSRLSDRIGARESRMARAGRKRYSSAWAGLGMFGLVGWSVAIPTLAGVGLGIWLDRAWPVHFSWTLALLLAGVFLGSVGAWYWISRERSEIDRQEGRSD